MIIISGGSQPRRHEKWNPSVSLHMIIFLSSRKEIDGLVDQAGEYEGPFTRWFCHEEMASARAANVNIIGVKESDPRFNEPDFAKEKERALTLSIQNTLRQTLFCWRKCVSSLIDVSTTKVPRC